MGFLSDLKNQIKEYLTGNYEVTETKVIPSVENVAFGKKAKKMKLCAFSIDLRKSSDLLFAHQKQTSGKIHKAFLTVVSKVIKRNGGQIRSFQGDCILAFWPAFYKKQISAAVRAALETKGLLSYELSSLFETYHKLDYGIGIDWGEVFIVRAGISRNANNNDLVYIGKCVNFATAIANQAKSPNNIEVSKTVYNNLEDNEKYVSKKDRTNMWRDGNVNWNDVKYKTKLTSYYGTF